MKADLIQAASEVITNQQILVNMVSRRVRQLSLGHRPLVQCAPGLREADIALTEIANGKLTFESTLGENGTTEAPARVMCSFECRRSALTRSRLTQRENLPASDGNPGLPLSSYRLVGAGLYPAW